MSVPVNCAERIETIDARHQCLPAEVYASQVSSARQAIQISVLDLGIGQSLSRDRVT